MTIEKVTPIIDENGVEFYVSRDGQETGMSISGLARFIGATEGNVRKRVLNKLREAFADKTSADLNKADFAGIPEVEAVLRLLQEGGSNTGIVSGRLTSPQNAVIIPSEVCEAIIFYIAFESSWEDEIKATAKKSFRQFARYGLHKFIHKVAGFVERQEADYLLTELQKVVSNLKELDQFATEYRTIRENTTSFMPGCNDLLDEIKDQHLLEAAEDGSLSLEGWLHMKGIQLSESKYRSLSHMVAGSYKSLVKRDPNKRTFKGGAKTRYNINVYEPQHFPILQICLNKIIDS
jgi:hypothetical protein